MAELPSYKERYGDALLPTTLCLLRRDDEVLLAMKKRGFGQGKWNGAGGKVQSGESVEEATVRETEEEVGVTPTAMREVGSFDYYFEDVAVHPDWNQRMHVYLADAWEGEPVESEEMRPQWFPLAAVPYGEMWEGDRLWMPLILEGKHVRGSLLFSKEGKLLEHEIE